MKLFQGQFLASRAARRIYWSLLVAATVPLLLFGATVYRAFDDFTQAQTRRQQVQSAKYVGLGLLEKLLAARMVLATSATTDRVDTLTELTSGRERPLHDVTLIDALGRVQIGSEALWQRWRDVASGLHELRPEGRAHLFLGREARADGTVPVLIALRDESQPGAIWLAEVAGDYLFGELKAGGSAEGICVQDAGGRPLVCSSPASLAPPRPAAPDQAQAQGQAPLQAQAQAQPEGPPSWRLFLRSDFGADDWVIVHTGAGSAAALVANTVARTAVLGALAALLIVALLSLRQVRRTLVPLENLIAGTRRLSRGEFSVRVDAAQADEFGELARSFNHMAERIGQQVEAMQVQSAIDLEILNGLDVARILQRVAGRLAALRGGASGCVVELDRAVPTLARAHRSDGSVIVLAAPPASALADCARDALVHWPVQPDWLQRGLTPWTGGVHVHGVHVGRRVIALLVLAHDGPAGRDDGEQRREVIELGDRVAVALTSAEREHRLQERATRDSLTGLANRLGLFEHVEQRLKAPARLPFSLLFVDLDRFKDINDAHGHQTGDALLSAVAQRLSSLMGDEVLVARPGGDEFVLVVPGSREQAQGVAALLVERLAEPVTLGNRVVNVACSVGMAHHPEDGHTVSDLMRRADMAMYAAKGHGGQRSAWFDASMDARVAERTALMADLHRALERNEFELHYQPRIESDGGAVRSAEALLRWRRGGELEPPSRFIDLLEDSGLIDAAGLWALDSACRQLVAWRQHGTMLDTVSVNVSTRQLHAPRFEEQVLGIVRQHGLEPRDLELEITESVFIGDSSEAIARLRRLREAGMGIALDDFGTGYSSLAYLHTLPITCLKVDRAFVSDLGQRDSALALTRTIIALAGALQLEVVAEGVETPAQARQLRELGCHKLQGFLYSRALVPDDFARYCALPLAQRLRAAVSTAA